MNTVLGFSGAPGEHGVDLRARLRAATIHLSLSTLIAAIVAAVVFGLWYPMPFREISGGRELFWIVVSVDVVLGPLITLAVFNRRKPRRELRRDLSIVVLMQLAGLAYGLHSVSDARPVVLALEGSRLRVVRAIDLDADDLAKAPPELRRLPWWGVEVVAARAPRAEEKLEAIDMALQGIDVGMRPEFWLPHDRNSAEFQREAQPLAKLSARYPKRVEELNRYVEKTGEPADRLGFLPMLARSANWVALIDLPTGAIVGYAPFDGF